MADTAVRLPDPAVEARLARLDEVLAGVGSTSNGKKKAKAGATA
jgi:hypothetical protein